MMSGGFVTLTVATSGFREVGVYATMTTYFWKLSAATSFCLQLLIVYTRDCLHGLSTWLVYTWLSVEPQSVDIPSHFERPRAGFQKVAPPPVVIWNWVIKIQKFKDMKPLKQIVIPDDIASLKIAPVRMRLLALIRKRPKLTNKALCKNLGIEECSLLEDLWQLRTWHLLEETYNKGKRVFRVTIEKSLRRSLGNESESIDGGSGIPLIPESDVPVAERRYWNRSERYSYHAQVLLAEIMGLKDLFSSDHQQEVRYEETPPENLRENADRLSSLAELIRTDTGLGGFEKSSLLVMTAPPKSVYEVAAYLRARFSAEVTVAILWCLGDWEFREAGEWFECIQHGQGNEEILYMEDYTDND